MCLILCKHWSLVWNEIAGCSFLKENEEFFAFVIGYKLAKLTDCVITSQVIQ